MFDFLVIWLAFGFFSYIVVCLHDYFARGDGWQKGDGYLLVISMLLGVYSVIVMVQMFYGWYVKGEFPEEDNESDIT